MGLVTGEFKHPTLKDVEIMVDQKGKGEERQPWEILSLSISHFSIRTPDEMARLGDWLVERADFIRDNYTKDGKRKREGK